METLKQKKAKSVYEKIIQFQENHNPKECKKYGVMAMKLPFLVQKAGLTQALAFVDMKGKSEPSNPNFIFLLDLADVVFDNLEGEESSRDFLLEKSRSVDLQDYILLTKNTMMALEWFKRYAQSILKISSTDTEDSE